MLVTVEQERESEGQEWLMRTKDKRKKRNGNKPKGNGWQFLPNGL